MLEVATSSQFTYQSNQTSKIKKYFKCEKEKRVKIVQSVIVMHKTSRLDYYEI